MKLRNLFLKISVIGISFLLLISISACSFGGSSSKDKLAKALEESILAEEDFSDKEKEIKEYAECMADALDGNISKQAYDAFIDWEKYQGEDIAEFPELSDEDNNAIEKALEKCKDLEEKITGIDDLESGSPSSGKTTLRNAMTSVKAYQTGKGITTFDGITAEVLSMEDHDLAFVNGTVTSTDPANTVAIVSVNSESILLLTRQTDSGKCFYARLGGDIPVVYGSSVVEEDEDCPESPGIGGGVNLVDNSQIGWDI